MISLRFSYAPKHSVELSFDNTATVRTAKEFLANKIATVPENITLSMNRQILNDATMLSNLGVPNSSIITATVTTSRTFRFLQPGKQPFLLPFRETATIADARRAISPKLKVQPDCVRLSYDNEVLPDYQRIVDLAIPGNRFITIEIANENIHKTKYRFILQGEGRDLVMEDEATVQDAINALMRIADRGTKSISLFYDGRPLKNMSQKLSSIGVSTGDFIVAECEVPPYKQLRDAIHSQPIIFTPRSSNDVSDESDSDSSEECQNKETFKLAKTISKVLCDQYAMDAPERKEDPPEDPMNVELAKQE